MGALPLLFRITLFVICKDVGSHDRRIPPGSGMLFLVDELKGKPMKDPLCDDDTHAEPFVLMDPPILEEGVGIEVFR
jgi:hypothetical protein